MDLNELLYKAIIASYKAGKEIITIRNKGHLFNNNLINVGKRLKIDKSYVTDADIKANDTIISILSNIGIPIISEEIIKIPKIKDYVWIIDPLDGTSEFIRGGTEFTVNIALLKNEKIILGVVYAPIKNELYFANKNIGSYKYIGNFNNKLLDNIIRDSYKLPHKKTKKYTIVSSKLNLDNNTKKFIKNISNNRDVNYINISSSLKFCMVAEGSADIYPRISHINEWDIAASHAILKFAGKNIYDINDKEIKYNKNNFLMNYFIAK